ncbi:MAG: aminotransferase class V-fold PLP-dependent enzyme [Thermoanaerobaculia bacterium]
MSDGIDVEALRREFPVTERWAYLNHGAIGPMPRRSADRMAELARTVAETGDRHWPERNDECERVRRRVAELLGAPREHEVAFVGNTSEGLSAVAWGLDWRPGDNVVGPEPEFPSDVYPWMSLAELGVEYRRVPERDGRVAPEDLVAAVDGRTRVVAVSWVQYASGHRLPLEPLAAACRDAGALLVLDAIQGVGALSLDVEAAGVDVCALASHKWILGPEGVGIFYVSDRVVERLRSTRHGWRSVAKAFEWGAIDPTPATGALRFEAGTLNVYGIHALGASVDLLLELDSHGGPGAVETRVLALADRVADGLVSRGFALAEPHRSPGETSGIVAGTHPDRPARALAEDLEQRGVAVSHRAGRFRVSPHVYNTEAEIDRLLDALDELL